MGAYLKGERIGYTVTERKRVGEGYHLREIASLKLNIMGTIQKVESFLKSSLNKDFSLTNFWFQFTSSTGKFEVEGKIEGKKLRLVFTTGGVRREEIMPLKEPIYLSAPLKSYIGKKGFEEGKRYQFTMFDPSTMTQIPIIVEIKGKEKVKIKGREEIAYHLKEYFKGMEIDSWVSREGEILKEETPLGLTLIKETKEEILGMIGEKAPSKDLLKLLSIPVDQRIENPSSLNYLKVRLKGIPQEGFDLDGERQRYHQGVVEIKREEITSQLDTYSLPFSQKGRQKYLIPSVSIQSKDTRILDVAMKIIGKEKDALKAVKLITEWVYQNIEKQPTLSIPSALEVLEEKRGDCNEHAILFTALARAVGIPTRVSTGLRYLNGGFYYHAWVEVYLNRWFSLDPVLGQFPADVTHIRFFCGDLDRQLEIIKIIGKLRMEILEWR